jgi:hypothetical protein
MLISKNKSEKKYFDTFSNKKTLLKSDLYHNTKHTMNANVKPLNIILKQKKNNIY